MSTLTTTFKPDLAKAVKGVIPGGSAGLAGGMVFGMLMGMMGMLPMVGLLIRQNNAVAGLLVHLAISTLIGAVYGTIATHLPRHWGAVAVAGMVNGMFWWVLGALILMPLGLGMPQMVLVVGQTQWISLMGHLIYGLITASVFVPLSQRL